jgi:hypothetical protein
MLERAPIARIITPRRSPAELSGPIRDPAFLSETFTAASGAAFLKKGSRLPACATRDFNADPENVRRAGQACGRSDLDTRPGGKKSVELNDHIGTPTSRQGKSSACFYRLCLHAAGRGNGGHLGGRGSHGLPLGPGAGR